jgi:cytochrome c553
MKNFRLIALSILGGMAANALAADSIPLEKIQEKAQTCAACHGTDGNAATEAQGQYPRLAGQYHDYLAKALHEYKTGERKNAIMAGFATTLTEAEIQGLATYYSKLPGKIDDLAHYEQGD